ncbi:MAG: FAD-dependent oxidoreductase [Pseudomonadota bacterium]
MNYDFKPYPFIGKHYEARLPFQVELSKPARSPVVIVGGGPVGLATALGLANHGIPSVLIEADAGVCSGSRAICISRRSLEIVERLGALKGFLDKGLPWTGGRSFYRDTEVLHFTMPQDENQKLPPMVNLAQYHIEQFLLDAAEKKADLIDIRWQTKVTGVSARENGVILNLSTPNASYDLDADWLVACDGGRSTVRDGLGLQLKGTTYEGRYVIVDIALESDRPTERLAYFDPPSNPGSTVLVHKQPDNVWRIDYQLREDEDPEQAVKTENVIPRVQSLLQMMGESSEWSPIWITLYKAHALTLEKYREGRVLFAGDAAHLVPIFGVRGANSGIDDADNLAWKLAFVVKGLASDRLLDSYSDERVFAAQENLFYGTKSTEFMAPPSFAFGLMRTAVLSLAEKHVCVRTLINPRQTNAITYVDSALNYRTAEQLTEFTAGPRPGGILPECPVTLVNRQGRREAHLTDFLGPWFTAFYFSNDGAIPNDTVTVCKNLSDSGVLCKIIPLVRHLASNVDRESGWDHTGRLFTLYGAQLGTLYLVRPDGHVMARWLKIVPEEILQAVTHALRP